ncbi:MAG: PAS domain-containing sensor histidine kinase [Acidimicrobiia bacterium]|nr:PAS domain-containing sensor histidine kinase [Acidimicrobiia bacterium]
MALLNDLAREHTDLHRDEVAHLHKLFSEWAVLADFCFADLILYVATRDDNWLIVGQVRPSTSQTIYRSDWVGSWANDSERAVLSDAARRGAITEGEVEVEEIADPARMEAIPVRFGDKVIAVLTREWVDRAGRQPGVLERTYQSIFDRFAAMIVEGEFPFHGRVQDSSAAPRVGDGVMTIDGEGRVEYVSPNASSALHRVGINTNPAGMRLAELGFHDGTVRQAFERSVPVIEEFEQGSDVTLMCRCVPIISGGEVTGGVLLLRDVTELRKRDRLLLSKDATIREIHHRVKNNLQTISSLLRLQARRLTNPEAKAAVSESVRRIRTIALVHEALSREPGDDVTFIEIVRPLLRLAEEGLQSPDRPVNFILRGDGGRIPAAVATPLSVVLTELLQNAVDHGFPEGSVGGRAVVALDNDETRLAIRVTDDGQGVGADFDIDAATGLGLSIVRTLVTTELNGTIEMRAATAADLKEAELDETTEAGTVVELIVPVELES